MDTDTSFWDGVDINDNGTADDGSGYIVLDDDGDDDEDTDDGDDEEEDTDAKPE